MDRTELEQLDRDALIKKAEDAGVSRARILTRPELIDELLLRSSRAQSTSKLERARGFFGRARDLLARVVEKGLHLPDAAERIRPLPETKLPARAVASALPTVTLAEIYATQGHKDRAVETLRRVLEREPEHAAARALLGQLEDASYVAPPPPLPPEEDAALVANGQNGASTVASDAQTNGGVDECVATPLDPTTLRVQWEVRGETLEHLRRARAGGEMALRVLVVVPSWEGPQKSLVDHDVQGSSGELLLRDLPARRVVRAAIGWRVGDTFVPTAQAATN